MSAVAAAVESGLVEKAVLFPACCEVCLGTQGPFWDTGVDRPIGPAGRGGDCHVYVCRNCMRRGATALGYAKGERMDELDQAADRLGDAEKERDEAQDAAHKMANELTKVQQEKLSLADQLESLRDLRHQEHFRIDQIIALANELRVGANGS